MKFNIGDRVRKVRIFRDDGGDLVPVGAEGRIVGFLPDPDCGLHWLVNYDGYVDNNGVFFAADFMLEPIVPDGAFAEFLRKLMSLPREPGPITLDLEMLDRVRGGSQ